MKKLVLSIVTVVIMVGIYQIQLSVSKVQSFSFSQNIDALAWGESGGPGCDGIGSLDCPADKSKVLLYYY